MVHEAGVATVTIDAPPLHVLDGPFVGGLLQLLSALEADESVCVVVFVSADPDFFVMHGDVEALVDAKPAETTPADEPNIAAATFRRIRNAPFLSIGVLDGYARGGGCEFLSALDLRIATPRSIVGQPEAPMGILPGAGGTTFWPRVVGRDRALEIILTGRDVTAGEALAIGWLTHLVPADELDDTVAALAGRIAALPRERIAAIKAVVDTALDRPGDALLAESRTLDQLMAAGSHTEPMRRFLAAGGQTRAAEASDITPLLDAMIGRPTR